MKRRKPLTARKALDRGKPIKPSNPKRKAKRFALAYGSDERVRWIQSLPCVACGARPSEAAHIRSKAAGGLWADVLPLCRSCHRAQHSEGIRTFQARRSLDLRTIADRIAQEGPR
jgi:hypothetical protein